MMCIFLPTLSPEISRVPGVVATLLNRRGKVGPTSRGKAYYLPVLELTGSVVSAAEMIPYIGDEIGSFLSPVVPDLEPPQKQLASLR